MIISTSAAAAVPGCGDKVGSLPKDYRLQLQTLLTEEAQKLRVVLHADLEGRSYRIEDFSSLLQKVGV